MPPVMQSLLLRLQSLCSSDRGSNHCLCGCVAMSPKGAACCLSYIRQSLSDPIVGVACL